jgi:hypothetical protein
LLPSNHWARNFTVDAEDIDYLTNLLLEKETPLTSEQLALNLIEKRLQQEQTAFEERYKDVQVYNPSQSYAVGQRLVFPHINYETATVVNQRTGFNPEYGDFNVIQVEFDPDSRTREFASDLAVPHKLSQEATNGGLSGLNTSNLTAEDIVREAGESILSVVEERLRDQEDLIFMSRTWALSGSVPARRWG